MKINVLLVALRSGFLTNDRVYPTLAVLYIAAILEKINIKYTLEDDFDFNDIDKYAKYTHILISCMTPQADQAYIMCRIFKNKYPDKVIAIGGSHPTYYFEECLKHPFDFVCKGDAEGVINKEFFEHDFLKSKTHAIYHLTRGEIMSFPRPSRVLNGEYLHNYNFKIDGKPGTSLITGRGCPMSCTFCEAAETTAIYYTPERIDQELADIKSLGYGGVYIFDDLFAISMKRVKEIAPLFKKHNLSFRANGHAKTMTEEMAKILSENGCTFLAFGAESASQSILDNVKKKTTIEDNYNFVECCRKYGIKVKGFFMLGLPGETYNTIAETEEFIQNTNVDFQLVCYYPYKGTEIRDNIDSGMIMDLKINSDVGKGYYLGKNNNKSGECVVRTKELSSDDIIRERDRIISKFQPATHSQVEIEL